MIRLHRYTKLCLIAITSLIVSACANIKHFISPDKQYTSQQTAPIKRVDSSQNQYYTVQRNETLYQVAHKFNVTERALILWNNLKSPYALKTGQVLQIFPNQQQNSQIVNQASTAIVKDKDNGDVYRLDDSTLSYDIDEASNANNADNKIEPIVIDEQKVIREEIIDVKVKQSTERKSIDGHYVVKPGDSLLGVANSFNLTLSEIANLNQIEPPYPVYIGQDLIVDPALSINKNEKEKIIQEDTRSQSQPKVVKAEENEKVTSITIEQPKHGISSTNSRSTNQREWQWPIESETIISDTDTLALLEGSYHQTVYSACSGKVIYSGIGVEGYGKMVIVSCQNDYMTAYSNLNVINISEGDNVKFGEKIGELGKFKGESVLSFEIRKDGSPVPIKSLISK